MLTHLSLFSGIGGIDLAAEAAGFRTVAFVERELYCQAVLRKHWPDVPILDDVREVTADALLKADIDQIDLVSGGFPCQPFSLAGARQGAEDERYLWPEFARIIREVKPRWVLAENVPGLLSIRTDDPGGVMGAVLRDLAEMGYRAGWCVYGAGDVGAPHQRDRVFIVAYSPGSGDGPGARAVCSDAGGDGAAINQQPGRGGTDVGDPNGSGFPGDPWRRTGAVAQAGHPQPDASGMATSNVAHPQQERPGWIAAVATRDDADRETTRWSQSPNRVTECRAAVADSAQQPEREPDYTADSIPGIGAAWALPRSGGSAADWAGDAGPTQSGLGGAPDGFPAWLDSSRWPAGPEEEQRPWEPPRVATGVRHRVARLRALGNAVVPAQVYPLLRAIAEIEYGRLVAQDEGQGE